MLKAVYNFIFPTHERLDDDVRRNGRTGTIEGYCAELGRWCDIDYLAGTNYDDCYWLHYSLK